MRKRRNQIVRNLVQSRLGRYFGVLLVVIALFSHAPGPAFSDPYGTVTTVSAVRALANGSIHIWVNDTLGPGVCARHVIASSEKDHNEKIEKIALAALLSGKRVKVQFESSTCEIIWLEIRAE